MRRSSLTISTALPRKRDIRRTFALTCFTEGGVLGGSDLSDWEVYRIRSLQGGLGFTYEKLRKIFKEFNEIEIRRMRELSPNNNIFGVDGLLTALFKKQLAIPS